MRISRVKCQYMERPCLQEALPVLTFDEQRERVIRVCLLTFPDKWSKNMSKW